MKAKIQTKSNYRNLNGQWLQVKEIVGTRVTCVVETEEYGKQNVDFRLNEVTEMNTNDTRGESPLYHLCLKNMKQKYHN